MKGDIMTGFQKTFENVTVHLSVLRPMMDFCCKVTEI